VTTRIRPLCDADLPEADRVFRLAFGTFVGLAEPAAFGGDTDYVRTRWRLDPAGAFAAEHDGTLVGSVFASLWGSVGFFGPLSVRPDLWNRKVAQALLEPVMARFATSGVTHAGLFTFAESAKHVGLYGKLGFAPRFLTVVAAKPVNRPTSAPAWSRLGAWASAARSRRLAACRSISDGLYPGLDLGAEMTATLAHGIGDVVLLEDGDAVVGFALCHVGAGTEAGTDTCYVKFGAVPSGPDAPVRFARLLDGCEAFAADAGAHTLVAGVNLARDGAAALLRARGFRTIIQGVAMHRPNEPGYCRADVYALDDWR
jgi:predicted N-acetyltransferase YhbS